jgi:hypothetical protein
MAAARRLARSGSTILKHDLEHFDPEWSRRFATEALIEIEERRADSSHASRDTRRRRSKPPEIVKARERTRPAAVPVAVAGSRHQTERQELRKKSPSASI